jgi:hypothetical protein
MATISIAIKPNNESHICQGDVFKNVRFNYLDAEDNESADVVEYIFPMAIIISQACDVDAVSKMLKETTGKVKKFMPSILMCPIYDKEEAKGLTHLDSAFNELSIKKSGDKSEQLFSSKEYNVVEQDWHYRFHALTVGDKKGNIIMENAVIDFKHYFTVPPTYLYKNREQRIFHIDSLFAEQITLKFATYLSRVAIP